MNGFSHLEAKHSHCIPERVYKRCNEQSYAEIRFTSRGINNLNEKYHLQTMPDFIYGFLDCDPKRCKGLEMLFSTENCNKELGILTQDMKFFIIPNIPYCDQEAFKKPTIQLKEGKEGLCLIAWYIDSESLECSNIRQTLNLACDYYTIEKDKADFQALHYSSSVTKSAIVTIIDLTAQDLPMLKTLSKCVKDLLSRVYKVDEKDCVQMYFHYPIINYNDLHLHIRVNCGSHPIECKKKFYLDDIIDHLENGRNMIELVTDRCPIPLEVNIREFFEGIDGVTISDLQNSTKIDSPMVECAVKSNLPNVVERRSMFG